MCAMMVLVVGACDPGRPPEPSVMPSTTPLPSPSPLPTPRGEFIARVHPAKPGDMPYRLFIPKAYDPQQRYPLIVWLHGAGGIGTDNAAQIAGDQIPGTHAWTTPERQAEHPAFVLVPQSSVVWANTASPDLGPNLANVDGILDAVSAEFSIDENRVYLLGQSNGGYGAWNLLSNRPERFAAAVLLCPIKGNITRAVHAAGLPIFPGLARYDEVSAGAINHALRFTAAQTRQAYVYPARHWASSSTDPARPPMGMRVRLKAGFDTSGYPHDARVVLDALKKYGMILADNGSNWYVSGVSDTRWDPAIFDAFRTVKGSDFEVVRMGTVVTP